METNKNVIFFGNGLNRVSEGLDWEELLRKISHGQILKDIPLTFQYEDICLSRDAEIFDKGPSCSVGEDKLKEVIADELSVIHGNDVYEALAKLPVKHYITTNYDMTLESTLKKMGYHKIQSDSNESRYSIHRYSIFEKDNDTKQIWHIHGNIDKRNSIIMGYDQYCGELSKMNDWVKGSYKIANEPIGTIHRRFSNAPDDKDIKSWIDLFFTSNIHIIGYSMPFDEIDLWWLLDKRKRLKWEGRMPKPRNITFYEGVVKSAEKEKMSDCEKCKEKEKEKEKEKKRKAKEKLLNVLDVRYVSEDLNDKKEYADYYKRVLTNIKIDKFIQQKS